jgi:hypothetical protein
MATKKDPAKPGYMSTELWAMVSYGLYTFGSKVGLSPEKTEDLVSSFSQIIQEYLGDNPIVSIIFGVIILYYTKSRTRIKTAEIYANAKMEMVKSKEKEK